MKTLYRKKAIALYENKMRVSYIVATVIMYIVAAIVWYIIAAIVPYTVTVNVSENDAKRLTREAFTATQAEIDLPENEKQRALFMPTSEDSFMRKLKLAEDAQSSIDFLVYDSYYEDYTMYFYTALLRAADRNVKVRILVDGKMGRLDGMLTDIGKLLQNHNNVEFYYYNEINLLDPAGLLVMMHDKVMLVDNKIAIVGGVNMGRAAYLSNFDTEVMITNSDENRCAGEIKRYFDDMSKSPLARRIVSKTADFSKKAQYIDEFTAFFGKSEYAEKEIDYESLGVAVDKVSLLHNGVVGNKKAPVIFQAVCNLSESSQKTTVVTPYTLLQNDKKKIVNDLARSSTEFELVTNSLYNTRNVAFADYYYTRKAYVNEYIDIYEYQAANQLHAKAFTFDGKFSVIGSFNFDERSCHIDTESVLVIDSAAFTAIVDEYIQREFVDNSLKVGLDNEYIPSDTVPMHDVPSGKHVLYRLYKALGIVRCLI